MLFLMQKNIIVHLIIIINFNIRERHCIQATWLLTSWIVLCSHLIDDSASPVHYNTEDLLLHLCVWLDIVFLIAPKSQQASRRLRRLLHFPKKNGCNAINENINECWIQITAPHKTKQKSGTILIDSFGASQVTTIARAVVAHLPHLAQAQQSHRILRLSFYDRWAAVRFASSSACLLLIANTPTAMSVSQGSL